MMLSVILAAVEMEQAERNKFEALYYEYKSILYYHTFQMVKNEADAEDVLQNAFIKIARNIKAIHDIKSRETLSFLLVITKNAALDFIRKNAKNNGISLDDAEQIAVSEDTAEALVSKLEYEKIVTVIRNIPAPYNEVLYLHYVRDYSIKKTAQLLGRKFETVKVQLVRGKKILAEKLSEVLYG
ncbi:MAG: RNA polymerase sigma factor [Clostridia bacterium]|nr:RNA polymerase sigma factor [Clostridia bacterium]